jgi:hypothetical protein
MQGKDEAAIAAYDALVRTYPGEEARCRYAMLLQKHGHADKAKVLFSEVLKLTEDAPRHYRQAQKEWIDMARRNLG